MRLFLFMAASLASLGLASASYAQETDHTGHHPEPAKPPAAAQTPPSSQAMTHDKMRCMAMMDMASGSGGVAADGAAHQAGHPGKMSEGDRKHCAEMMAQMHPADAAKPPKK